MLQYKIVERCIHNIYGNLSIISSNGAYIIFKLCNILLFLELKKHFWPSRNYSAVRFIGALGEDTTFYNMMKNGLLNLSSVQKGFEDDPCRDRPSTVNTHDTIEKTHGIAQQLDITQEQVYAIIQVSMHNELPMTKVYVLWFPRSLGPDRKLANMRGSRKVRQKVFNATLTTFILFCSWRVDEITL